MATLAERLDMVKCPPLLGSVLRSLKTYIVDWKFTFVPKENVAYEPGIDREEADLDKANVVSSQLAGAFSDRHQRHYVLLDIDYEAFLVRSSTAGHYHLYLPVPGGVPHKDYMELLALLASCGVIEAGYAEVSIKRGHSDLRLPWVNKSENKKHSDEEPDVNLKHIPPSPTDPDEMPF